VRSRVHNARPGGRRVGRRILLHPAVPTSWQGGMRGSRMQREARTNPSRGVICKRRCNSESRVLACLASRRGFTRRIRGDSPQDADALKGTGGPERHVARDGGIGISRDRHKSRQRRHYFHGA